MPVVVEDKMVRLIRVRIAEISAAACWTVFLESPDLVLVRLLASPLALPAIFNHVAKFDFTHARSARVRKSRAPRPYPSRRYIILRRFHSQQSPRRILHRNTSCHRSDL